MTTLTMSFDGIKPAKLEQHLDALLELARENLDRCNRCVTYAANRAARAEAQVKLDAANDLLMVLARGVAGAVVG